MRQYKIETEALAGGVPDLIGRHQALDRLADTISPHWRPVIGRLPDGTPVTVLQAKHRDATSEAPITIQFTAAVPGGPGADELRKRMRSSAEFGTTVEIPGEFISGFALDGPPELGLPGSQTIVDRVVLLELPETQGLPHQQLAIYEPGAAFPIATLGFEPATRTRGPAGGVRLVATDTSRIVQLVTELRRDGSATFNLQLQQVHPILPSAVLPGLQFMRAAHPPNILKLHVRLNDQTTTDTSEIPDDLAADPMPDDMYGYIEDLAVIQEKLHHPFPLPPTATRGDIDLAARVRRLLNGERTPWVRGSITMSIDPSKVADFKAQFPPGGSGLRISWDDQEITFGENVVHTGPMYMIGAVTVIDLAAIPDNPAEDEDLQATFTLVGDSWFEAQFGVPDDEQSMSTEQQALTQGRVAYAPGVISGNESLDNSI